MSPRHQRKPGRGLLAALPALLLGLAPAVPAADCDHDGVRDDVAIADGTSLDCDANGIPDDCDLAAPLFPKGATVVLDQNARAFAAGDIDGDGDLDFVVGTRTTLDVLRNDGDGRFELIVEGGRTEIDLRSREGRLRLADLDGDGDSDAILCATSSNFGATSSVALFANDGGSRLGRRHTFALPGNALPDVAAADLDGDGHVDIAVTVPFGIAVFRGGEAWSFELAGRIEVGSNPMLVEAADVDGDGDVDLATANRLPAGADPGSLALLLNDGTGGFTAAWSRFAGTAPTALLAADLDGDGAPELAAGVEGAVAVLRNLGAGTFDAPRRFEAIGQASSLDAADADADGHVDLVATTMDQTASVLWNDGRGWFDGAASLWLPPPLVRTSRGFAAAGDVDGDRRIDLVGGVVEGLPMVFGGAGPRSFSGPIVVRTGGEPSAFAAADLDGDGDLDLAVGGEGSAGVTLLRNDGRGRFVAGANVALGSEPSVLAAAAASAIAAADLDGDGAVDLVVAAGAEDAVVPLWNDGADGSTFTAGPSLDAGSQPIAIAVGDWDGDGDPDLAVGTFLLSVVHVFRNQGGRSFERSGTAITGFGTADVEAADIDGDGDLDLLTANDESRSVSVLRNRGDGRFDPAARIDVGNRAVALAVADLDGDGELDAAVATRGWTSARGELIVLGNRGGGVLEVERRREFRSAFRASTTIGVGDADGDGRPDLLAGGMVLLLNRRGLEFEGRTLRTDGAESHPAFVDLDGDGLLDIAAAVPSVGGVLLHFANPARDCDGNGVPDRCDIASGDAPDADGNGIPDACDPDCDGSGIPDVFELERYPERDCDGSGVLDACEIADGRIADADADGVPDRCEGTLFHRGDPNANGRTDLADVVFLLGRLFLGRGHITCLESADVDDNGTINITDPIALLRFLFERGAPPAPPGPASHPCGIDPETPEAGGDLGCAEYAPCR